MLRAIWRGLTRTTDPEVFQQNDDVTMPLPAPARQQPPVIEISDDDSDTHTRSGQRYGHDAEQHRARVRREFQELPDEPPPQELYPYRSYRKLRDAPDHTVLYRIPKWIPKRQKAWGYAHVHGFGTWMADIIFIGLEDQELTAIQESYLRQHPRVRIQTRHLKLLVCIHCNSRYAVAYRLPDMSIGSIREALDRLHDSNLRGSCTTLITDAQGSIQPNREKWQHHIRINMSDPHETHNYLSLVDRFGRTLRDMLFNVRIQGPPHLRITMALIDRLIEIYDTTPHTTLSTVMGFPVTPWDAFRHAELQEEIVRRVSGRNYDLNMVPPAHGAPVFIKHQGDKFAKRRNSVADDLFRVRGRPATGAFDLENVRTGEVDRYRRTQFVDEIF